MRIVIFIDCERECVNVRVYVFIVHWIYDFFQIGTYHDLLKKVFLLSKICDLSITTMDDQDKYTLTWHIYSDHLREALKEMNFGF